MAFSLQMAAMCRFNIPLESSLVVYSGVWSRTAMVMTVFGGLLTLLVAKLALGREA